MLLLEGAYSAVGCGPEHAVTSFRETERNQRFHIIPFILGFARKSTLSPASQAEMMVGQRMPLRMSSAMYVPNGQGQSKVPLPRQSVP
jgi:hypothetical protein